MATTVAVLGGGVARSQRRARAGRARLRGHRLRGSATRLGGKARSLPVPGSGTGGRRDLPGRARLPLLPRLLPPPAGHDGADPVGVARLDHLVGAERILLAQARRARNELHRARAPAGVARGLRACVARFVLEAATRLGVPPQDDGVLRRPAADAADELRRAPLRAVGAPELVGLRRRRAPLAGVPASSSPTGSRARSSPRGRAR